MLKKIIKYTDFNGVDRTETFYFNLTTSELTEMDLTTAGGMKSFIERITNTQDQAELIRLFKELILKAYGQKSDDGKRFVKSQQLRDEFSQTMAYDTFFMKLATDEKEAIKFVNGIMPADVVAEAAKNGNDKAALLSQIPGKIEESQNK